MIEIEIKSKKHLLEILKNIISDKEVIETLIPKLDEKNLPSISYSEETHKPAKKEKTKKLKVVKSKSVKLKEETSSKKPRTKKS
jgi:hypothetical protein